MIDCCCGNPEGTNKECERCRLFARIASLEAELLRVAEVVCVEDAESIDRVLAGEVAFGEKSNG